MASILGQYLNSINNTKRNEIRHSDAPDVAEKGYPFFPVARSLSYFPDTILFVNELNTRMLSECHVTNLLHYEFLLYALPKGKRFAKWSKPPKEKYVESVAQMYKCSKREARLYLPLLTEDQLKQIEKRLDTGGKK